MKTAVLVYIQFYRTRDKVKSHFKFLYICRQDSVVSWASRVFGSRLRWEGHKKGVSVSDRCILPVMVVQTLHSATHRINHHTADKQLKNQLRYPLSHVAGEKRVDI